MKKSNNLIRFQTESFKHEVLMSRKELGWDVYLCGKCIMINATREEIQMLYKMLTRKK